jgi:hypothetical protein
MRKGLQKIRFAGLNMNNAGRNPVVLATRQTQPGLSGLNKLKTKTLIKNDNDAYLHPNPLSSRFQYLEAGANAGNNKKRSIVQVHLGNSKKP